MTGKPEYCIKCNNDLRLCKDCKEEVRREERERILESFDNLHLFYEFVLCDFCKAQSKQSGLIDSYEPKCLKKIDSLRKKLKELSK